MNEFSKFGEYGLIGLIIGAVILLLFIVIKWTLATTRDILKQAAEERCAWQLAIGGINKAIDEHTSQAKAFHEQVNEAHRFQRSEHQEMIIALKSLNGK